MTKATIDKLQNRMNKQIEYSVRKNINRDLIFAVLRKQQIAYKYFQLMRAFKRKHSI